jgi:hypothetical protein
VHVSWGRLLLVSLIVGVVPGLGVRMRDARSSTASIPRCVNVHWLNQRKTHGWALTPYFTGARRANGCAFVGQRKQLCGWKVYGTDRSSFRVCETYDRGKHWRIAFTNHARKGDDVTIEDGPIGGTNYFDSINAFWRTNRVKYVSGFKGPCYWTVRSFNHGRNWRNVEGTQECGQNSMTLPLLSLSTRSVLTSSRGSV